MKVNKLQTPNFLVQQDCLSCIPDSKDQDSGFEKQNVPNSGIWGTSKITRITEFGFSYVG